MPKNSIFGNFQKYSSSKFTPRNNYARGLLSIAVVTNDSSVKITEDLTEKTVSNEKSTEDDYIEEYWEQHPNEDPCNDPTAKAFGLCK